MNCSIVAETFVTKFNIKENYIYAKVHWANNETDLFCIQIFSSDRSWSGSFSYEQAKSFEERLHENRIEYSENVKNALKRNSDMFLYDFKQLEKNPCESEFCWKKKFADSTALLVHGIVTVQWDVPTESKDCIIDYLLKENEMLQNTIESLKRNNETLNSELDECKSEFEKLIDIKDNLETTLYGKFIQLLNSKKRRIQLLEEHVETMESKHS
ncbi:unnamed protein product [Euphydryas editha]|uniref:XRCC4 n=1 Tax=Euphydryas editha TaxID=104508 RepID=A0AAU9U463_EUPED|nr:unnamed protein product [Euphydryas editha]